MIKNLKLIRKSKSTGISQHINIHLVLTGFASVVTSDDCWHLCCLFLMMPTFCETTVQKDEREVKRFLTQKASKSISFCLYTHTHTPGIQCLNWEDKHHVNTHLLLNLLPLNWCDHLQNTDRTTPFQTHSKAYTIMCWCQKTYKSWPY